MKKKKNELSICVEPIIEAMELWAKIGSEACEKLEKNEPIDFFEREVLLFTPFMNKSLKRILKKEKK